MLSESVRDPCRFRYPRTPPCGALLQCATRLHHAILLRSLRCARPVRTCGAWGLDRPPAPPPCCSEFLLADPYGTARRTGMLHKDPTRRKTRTPRPSASLRGRVSRYQCVTVPRCRAFRRPGPVCPRYGRARAAAAYRLAQPKAQQRPSSFRYVRTALPGVVRRAGQTRIITN